VTGEEDTKTGTEDRDARVARSPSTLGLSSIAKRLDDAPLVPEINIKIAPLDVVTIDGVDVSYSAAQISERVEAHVHLHGPETYLVLRGTGLMHIGEVTFGAGAAEVAWQEAVEVTQGQLFTIPPGFAHSLENAGNNPLEILFAGSPRNLTTDRIVVDNP
jgi:mannose-6-phosphate isomerase-like protein (cupin superfamily)